MPRSHNSSKKKQKTPRSSTKTTGEYTQKSIFTPLSTLVMRFKPLSIVFFVGLILFGLLSYTTFLRKEGFPSVAVPISVGGGQYFVNDAEQVDVDVAQPLEQTISRIDGVVGVTTTANDNTFSFVADLDSTLTNEQANDIIEQTITDSGVLPESARFNVISIDAAKFLGEYDLLVSVFSREDATLSELESRADALAAEFTELGLVAYAQTEQQFTVNPSDPTDRFKSSFGRAFDSAEDQFRQSVTIGVAGITGDEFDLFELDDQVAGVISQSNQAGDGFIAEQTADLTTSVQQDIDSLQGNVITGAIVVTIISALIISWRVSVLTAFFIVAVLLVSAAVLYVVGYTLNTITLFSLVLALGLFVDDATIIAEAIYAKRDRKKKPLAVVRDAINSIGTASFSGTLTTALVFSPLLFITGILGDFIFQMPLTVIISLVVSFILSITLIPLLANYTILGAQDANTDRTRFMSAWLADKLLLLKTRPKVGRTIGLLTVLLSVGLIGTGIFFFGKLGADIFPAGKDGNELVVNINYDDDTSIQQAEALADTVSAGVVEVLGENLSRSMYGSDQSADASLASIDIELIPYGDRSIASSEMADDLTEFFADFNGAEVTAQGGAGGPPEVEFPFLSQIAVDGSAEDSLRLSEDILAFLSGYESEQPNGDIVQLQKSEIGYVDSIVRLDGRQFFEIRAGFDADGTTSVIDSFRTAVQEEFNDERLAGYGLTSTDVTFDLGQETDFEESFNALPMAALGALLVMVVLLTIQFRSLLKPLLILLALPFSLFGVGLGLFVTENPVSFFVMIGMIGLIGIAVNNTILLVDNATHHQKDGMDPVDAMAQAIRERFRPLATTTLTTIAALLPLALTNPFWEALSFTIIFGLASSTILVLLAFPYIYLWFEWLGRKVGRIRGLVILAVTVGLMVLSARTGKPFTLLLLALPVYYVVKKVAARRSVRT